MSTKFKALLALLATVFLWSLLVVIARGTVVNVRPMTLLFLRLLVAAIAFTPLFISRKPWKNSAFAQLTGVSLLSTINLVFFMWGIQYTTASASQLIYAAMPILIIVISTLFLKENYPLRKILGILIGLLGIIFIIYLSAAEKGTTITGTLIGNLAMVIAMTGWMLYILSTKKLSKIFSPVEIGSVSIIVSFIISIPLFLVEIIWLKAPLSIPMSGIWSAIYMGFFGTFLTYLLHQYAIKNTSPLTVSLTSYIQPITTTILAVILLGEKITVNFLLGASIVFSGIFLATTLEVYHRRK